jgi:MFS family permease
MVMTPLHMNHGGAELDIIGFVISVHVLGMFAFSPLVGWVTDKAGRAAVLALGSCVLLVAVFLAGRAPECHSTGLAWGLFLLGLGWSCCLVASSALLVDAVPLSERPGVQGASDLVMGLFAAAGGAVAGVVVAGWGYGALNIGAGVLSALVLAAAFVARGHRTEHADEPA